MFLTCKGVEGSPDANGNIGEAITLECQFYGYVNGLVERMWTRGENALAVSDKYSMQYMEEVRSENGVNYTIGNFYLTIQNLNSFDEGNYTCVIENNDNKEVHTVFLSTSSGSSSVPRATNTASISPVDKRATTDNGIIVSAKGN